MAPNRDKQIAGPSSAGGRDRVWDLAWRLCWIGAPLVAAMALLGLASSDPATPALLLALLILPAPAALSFVEAFRRDFRRGAGPVLWGLACAGGAILAGGLSGPFAVLCMAPLAAAAAAPDVDSRTLAQGTAAALGAVILVMLAQVAGLSRPVPAQALVATGLGFLATSGTALTLAAGLARGWRRLNDGRRDDGRRAAYLQGLIEGQPNLILALSPDGRARSLHGRPPPGVREPVLRDAGLADLAVAADRPALQAALTAAVEDGEGVAVFTPAAAPAATLTVCLRRAAPDLIVGILRDASAERAREAVLEEARADAESRAAGRARFIANMSHELRTPLNAIMGFSDIINNRLFGPISDRYGEYAGLIHESGGHLLDLINDLLDMSKIEAERFELSREEFDGRDAVTAALRLLRVQADSAGVKLRGVLPPRPLDIDADRRALKQIVLNLVSNALKFTPKGGSVTVSTFAVGQMFELVVSDTGSGIAPEDLDRLGRPYEQAGNAQGRAGGTGLGLSLVRGLAELHGGEMILESRLGAGTSVTVRLPVMVRPVEQPPMPSPDDPTPVGGNVVPFTPPKATSAD